MACHNERCLDYMMMMIAIIYIQNVLTRYFQKYFWPSIVQWFRSYNDGSLHSVLSQRACPWLSVAA